MFHFKYFNGKLSQGYVSLFSGRMIQLAAAGLLGLFIPIFLLLKLNKLEYVFLYYIISSIIYFLLLPWGARFVINKIGLRNALRISVFLDAMFFTCFVLIDRNPIFFIGLSLIIWNIDRLMFWVPFHTDFAKFTDRLDRGKEISLIWAARSFLSVVMPVAAGFLIAYFGFNVLFLMAILLYLSAIFPFLTLPETKEKYSWGGTETFKNLFKKMNRRLVVANIANGAENVVGVVIWPIFIWQILNENYIEVGAISSVIIFVAIISQLIAGRYTDLFDKRKMLYWGTPFYALGWLAKTFVITASQIFIIGAYHSFARIFKDTPFDSLNYEIMADKGHYVDEFTVLRELAVHLGKILMLAVAILIAWNFGINWTFAFAALISLFISAL